MPFRFLPGEPVEVAARRVAAEGLTAAADRIRAGDVHGARKWLKRLRAMATLVGLPKDDRTALGDAGRLLAGARDAEVLLALLDDIGPEIGASVEAFGAARVALVDEVATSRRALDVAGAEALLAEVGSRAAGWAPSRGVEHGLRRGYRACRAAMHDAAEEPSGERLHEWRKTVKRHWHHCELLGLDDRARQVHDLSDLLGDDHDLHVLGARFPDLPGLPAAVAARQSALREQALALGEVLLAEKPRKASERLLGSLDR